MDHERGHVTVEAGIRWPTLLDEYLIQLQTRVSVGRPAQWGFAQKRQGPTS